jgi:hypothetical protein
MSVRTLLAALMLVLAVPSDAFSPNAAVVAQFFGPCVAGATRQRCHSDTRRLVPLRSLGSKSDGSAAEVVDDVRVRCVLHDRRAMINRAGSRVVGFSVFLLSSLLPPARANAADDDDEVIRV